MKDEDGNLVSVFTKRIDRDFIVNRNERVVEVGTKLSFYAIVSKHNLYGGTKSTQVKKLSKY